MLNVLATLAPMVPVWIFSGVVRGHRDDRAERLLLADDRVRVDVGQQRRLDVVPDRQVSGHAAAGDRVAPAATAPSIRPSALSRWTSLMAGPE